MRNHNPIHLFALPLCFLFWNCAGTNVPAGWLSQPEQIHQSGYGGWIDVTMKDKTHISGELIAIEKDSLFLASDALQVVAHCDIQSARLVTYEALRLGGYVILGLISTISNGFFLIFSAPLWIIGGSAAASSRSFEPIMDYPESSMDQLKPFARFPQGFPSTLDRQTINIKPILK
jgi:hypothetical protein